MRRMLFSGYAGDYRGMEGPHKMKHYTGNVVDLDTVRVKTMHMFCYIAYIYNGYTFRVCYVGDVAVSVFV
jgi:hypothetical protein